MRRKCSFVLVLVLALSLVSVGAVSAKAPGASDRTGELHLKLNTGLFASPPVVHGGIVWYGTVAFDHGEYGIVYMTVLTHANKTASHWTETWEIYDEGTYAFTVDEGTGVLTGFATSEDPVAVGSDSGITHLKKLTWMGNGTVTTADGPFEQWEGRRAHTEGVLSFAEAWGEGTIRFN